MRINMRIKLQLILIVMVLANTATVGATTLARLSIEQMAAAADHVAHVRYAASESLWENAAIWTVTTFAVVESMKGTLPPQVKVRLPGGRVGHLTASVDGTPNFSPGDDAIVFLEQTSAGDYSVTAWAEGTFRISRDLRTGRETVTQDSSAFAVFDPATRAFRAEGIRRMPIEQFRARVASAIEHAQERTR